MFVHPSGYPDFPSDNQYADVNGDDLPDMIFSRIPANDATQLKVMVSKFINYERNPPVKASFYNNPITALGWQTDRWFQLCSEVVGGYLKKGLGKTPVRINAVYAGDPTIDSWSTASNTSTIMSYFGPAGQGYIPGTPQETGGFSGGTASGIVTAINNGSFLLLHRDHGFYQGWGEPDFTTYNIGYLRNVNNELPFIFSINCQTGAYQGSTECLAEKFERYTYNGQNSGALGVIAPTEVSYSFLNDTYLWGVFDNLFPGFMPDKTTKYPTSFVMPAFAAAAGKYFLYQSSWSGYGTTYQQVTARLFHCFGDAFGNLYTEVPQALTVNHLSAIPGNSTSFSVTANTGSLIALTVNGNIIGTANGTGSAVSITIPQQNPGDVMIVTVTKQNYFRYTAKVNIGVSSMAADFSGTPNSVLAGGSVTYTDLTNNNPTSWSWSFPGGTPSSSILKNPVVSYPTNGIYNVTLTASNSTESNTKTKTAYVTVGSASVAANFSANKTSVIAGDVINYSDLSTNTPTSWLWSFPGGTPSSSTLQNPAVTYSTAGTYNVTLTATNSAGSNTLTKTAYILVGNAIPVADFVASLTSLITDATTTYSDLSTNNPTSWAWSFPGGIPSTSTLQNPTVSYTSSGTYSVSLTATNSAGSSTKTKTSYITVSPAPPVAGFSADVTKVLTSGHVNFTDLSTESPGSWSWSFTGGTPATSSLQNPSVTYSNSGVYDVTLTVSNSSGTSTKIMAGYINVWNDIVTYCASGSLSASTEWISSLKFGTFTKTSGSSLYSDFTAQQIAITPGSKVTFSLATSFSGKTRKEFWRIWIDYNNDGDFTDAGETVYSGTGPKGSISSSVVIASSASGQARMRVSMKYGAYPSPCEKFNYGETEDYMLNFSLDAMPALMNMSSHKGLTIYPNPTTDFVTVVTGSENSEAYIYELNGRLLRNLIINNQEVIDLQDLPKGIYVMKVLINSSTYYGKIVKQ
jgi:PKD repeat protein